MLRQWTFDGTHLPVARGLVIFPQIDLITIRFIAYRWTVRKQISLELNSTSSLTIAENQPIGTVVGEFNATDPDGDEITYHLVSGFEIIDKTKPNEGNVISSASSSTYSAARHLMTEAMLVHLGGWLKRINFQCLDFV